MRLWPLSRAGYPKQVLVLTAGNRSLFQLAVPRPQRLDAADIALTLPLCANSRALVTVAGKGNAPLLDAPPMYLCAMRVARYGRHRRRRYPASSIKHTPAL